VKSKGEPHKGSGSNQICFQLFKSGFGEQHVGEQIVIPEVKNWGLEQD
jgi:hypothetical protein